MEIMSNRLRRVCLFAFLGAFCAAGLTGCKMKDYLPGFPMELNPDDFADTWVGFGDWSGEAYKLVLQRGGGGVLYTQNSDSSRATKFLAQWTLRDGMLVCNLKSDGTAAVQDQLRLSVNTTALDGALTEGGKWKTHLRLHRVTYLQDCLQRAGGLGPADRPGR